MHPSTQYAKDVLSDKILACRWVKLACQRQLDDLKHGHKKGLWFDESAADHALEFFSHLKLWKGKEYKGKEFVLGPHYQFIISCLMGWKKDNGFRRFEEAHIEMGRKGAKSTIAGGLGAYFFIADGEEGAEIYTAAVKEKQAKIVWNNIKNLTKKSIFKKLIEYYTTNLSIETTWSKCEFVVGDPKGLDGLDTHFASLDELHAHTDSQIYDLIVDSVGSRSQPLVLTITTAGFDQSGVCFQNRIYLTSVLKGVIEDDSLFGIIFTLDMKNDWPELITQQEKDTGKKGTVEDDWTNEDLWVKPLPGLCGITKNGIRYGVDKAGNDIPGYMTKIERVRKRFKAAKEIVAKQNNFLTKRMNVWTQQHTRWIDLVLWDGNFTKEIYIER